MEPAQEVQLLEESQLLVDVVFQVNVLESGSGGVSSGGQISACAGIEKPSLFSGSGSSLLIVNPFAAAMASLGPVERYKSLYGS